MAQTLSAESTLLAVKTLIDPWFAAWTTKPAETRRPVDVKPAPVAATATRVRSHKAAGKTAAPAKRAATANGATANPPPAADTAGPLFADEAGATNAAAPSAPVARKAGNIGRPRTRTTAAAAPPPTPAANGNGATAAA
jgi:hypothetical protein